jgi:hypothetical protein
METFRNPELSAILQSLQATTQPIQRTTQLEQSSSSSNERDQLVVQPSEILTWPEARQYVIANIYSNSRVRTKIKQLIRTQHEHERRLWSDRQALIAKHGGRLGKQKDADALLRSIGGVTPQRLAVHTSSRDEKLEVLSFDQKVYEATIKLVVEIDRELRGCGVPFYAFRHELVQPSGAPAPGKIGKGELRSLQRRMLQLLEDLFKD